MKFGFLHKKKGQITALALGASLGLAFNAQAQVSGYVFSQTTGTYNSIAGVGTVIDSAYYSGNTLDSKGWPITLPFAFHYNGGNYTNLYVNSNGAATLGTVTNLGSGVMNSGTVYDGGAFSLMDRDLWGITVSTGVSVTTGSNIISNVTNFSGIQIGTVLQASTGVPSNSTVTAFDPAAGTITMNANATANSTSATLRWGNAKVITHTLGTAPNRTFVVEWNNFSDYSTSVRSHLNFQLHLEESTGKVNFVYGNQTVGSSNTQYVGLRGKTTAQFNNRTSSSSWTSTTAGTSAGTSVTVAKSATNVPPSGLTFTWTPPNCVAPGSVTVNPWINTAEVNWSAPLSTPAGYEYYYSTSSTAPSATVTPSGTTLGTVTTTNLTGLTAATNYYLWVRSVCSPTEKSVWSSVSNFTTACAAVATPFTQSFSAGSLPSCWNNENTSNSTSTNLLWRFTGTMDYGTSGNGGRSAGSFTWVDASSPYNSKVILTTPPIDLTGLTTPYLEFDWLKNHATNSTAPFTRGTSSDNTFSVEAKLASGAWTTIFSDTSNNPAWRTEGIVLPASFAGETVRFRFSVDKGGANPDVYDNVALDEIKVKNAPSCFTPAGNAVAGVTSAQATITWNAPAIAPANGYEYYYSTSNTAPTANTSGTANASTTATINTLTANTKYFYWVRSVCSGTDKSDWTNVDSFFTGHCLPNGSTGYYITGASSSGASTDINYTATSGVGYVDQTTTQLVTYPTNSFNVNITPSSGTNLFYAWVDWNNDLDFADAGETIFATTSYTANYSGTMSIPAGTPLGSYKMRVANSWSGTITACGPAQYGNYVDFTLVVAAPPTCVAPTGLTAVAPTANSVNLSWTASITPPANGYDYYYSTTNTAPTASTVPSGNVLAGATTATVGSLSASTTYYFWVRSNCSASDVSGWTSVATITTPCAAYTAPFSETFTNTTFPPNCWERAGGLLAAPVVFDAGSNTHWGRANFADASLSTTNGAARINIYGTTRKSWLITPSFDLGTTPKTLHFNLARTDYNSPDTLSFSNGQMFAVVISTDNGVTWTSANTLRQWTDTSFISNTGQTVSIDLAAYTGLVKIGFYGQSTNSLANDLDIFVDSVTLAGPSCVTPIVNLGADTTICQGNNLTLDAGSGTGFTYAWNTGDTTQTLNADTAGIYVVTVNNGLCSATDTISVNVAAIPTVDLGNDTAICDQASFTLSAGSSLLDSYVWNDNSTNNTLNVTASGTYYVTATNTSGCTDTDTIQVTFGETPSVAGITTTGTSPNFNFSANSPQNATTYNWNFGDGNTSTDQNPNHTYAVTANDEAYTVTLIVSNDCGADTVTTTVTVNGAVSIKGGQLDASKLSIFPNPTNETFTIEHSSKLSLNRVSIINMIGQVVMSFDAKKQSKIQVNTGNIPSGIYQVKLDFAEGMMTKKVEIIK